jgi:hypothetical protein
MPAVILTASFVGRCVAVVAAALVAAGCGGSGSDPDATDTRAGVDGAYRFPPPPRARDGPLDPRIDRAASRLMRALTAGELDHAALSVLAASRDARLGWLLSDVLRFVRPGAVQDRVVAAFGRLTGVDVTRDPLFERSAWQSVTNHLIAWNLRASPRYRQRKAQLFLAVEPRWKPFFADPDADVDWRLVSWGGVLIDHRRRGDDKPCPRGCIPALDDPALTSAAHGSWYPDSRLVFGVVVGGDAVALPKNIMEVHEMVNISIGGRRMGIPYCTLCGSAQAYFVDSVPTGTRPPLLRTSGLLSRSNKMMYDRHTRSLFDTFTGRAVSGPLQDARITLEQATVVTSSWGDWKKAHPRTTIVARDGGIGRTYPADPLRGRDDDGPIFPIGDADPRLPVQTQIVGVIAPGGHAVAFPAAQARAALADGKRVAAAGVRLERDGSGLRARSRTGRELVAHQAFWFAWSQFHPRTRLWRSGAPGQR